ncbi:UNKNOWN [Stylonychia lemnae]|uniref:Nucleolar protein Dnt1-like N-terminal domain-containing protein n=1 Tax=Stylonychia lemnae TaxID=5949 RepID=A0A078B967_STYLE|nr:UNKNOWN [Stylonychia lemnae]|eukprot:CDW91065.1 UNKNOWN [Stylonychia lemnae]
MAAPNMTIAQLKKKIENEMASVYPQDDPYHVGTIKDSTNYNITNGTLVGEVFKHGDTIDVYPDIYEVELNAQFSSNKHSSSNDLVGTLKNVHYSVVSKLTDTYIREYDDKLDLLQSVISMGLTNELHLVQNLCVVLNKIFNADLIRILDEHPKVNNLLELVILVMQHWVKEMIDKDNFVLNNTLVIIEMLCKSYGFCSRFKNRDCMEKLLTISKQPYINSSTKQQIFRIVHALNSSTSLHALNHYELSRFDNMRGSVADPLERRIASSLLKGEYKDSLMHKSSSSTGLYSSKSLANMHMHDYDQRTKNFFTPVVKKELVFSDEERILQKTLFPEKTQMIYSSILSGGQSISQSKQYSLIYIRPPSPKGALSKFLRSTVEDVIQRQKEEQIKDHYNIHPYKVTYLKDAYKVLDKYPPIKLPYSTNLLNDYCQMLHPEINNRDVIIFAMHQIDRIIEHCVQDIMTSTERFLAVLKLFEFYNFPENARDSQIKILDYTIKYLTEERAVDAFRNETIMRIVKCYKVHHPSLRNILQRFVERVIDLAFVVIDLPKLINLAICDITSFQEVAMKAIMVKSDIFNQQGSQSAKETMDIEMHIHIPFLVDCAKSFRHSVQFKNYSLQTIANCAQREYLKGHILHHGGVEAFIDGLKDLHNVMGNRICAKALVAMTENDSSLKGRVVSAITPEYKMAALNEHDSVVNSYLRLLLNQ